MLHCWKRVIIPVESAAAYRGGEQYESFCERTGLSDFRWLRSMMRVCVLEENGEQGGGTKDA